MLILSIMALYRMALRIMVLNRMVLSILALSIMALIIVTFSIMTLCMALNANDPQLYGPHNEHSACKLMRSVVNAEFHK